MPSGHETMKMITDQPKKAGAGIDLQINEDNCVYTVGVLLQRKERQMKNFYVE